LPFGGQQQCDVRRFCAFGRSRFFSGMRGNAPV
jgi:hypothetical protein